MAHEHCGVIGCLSLRVCAVEVIRKGSLHLTQRNRMWWQW